LVKVKICGITNLEDALLAIEAGADALGFILAEASPRMVSPPEVREIVGHLPPFVCKVGVFVDSALEDVSGALEYCGLDLAQLHGDEPPEHCEALFARAIKAFRVRGVASLLALADYRCPAYFLDSYAEGARGGTGVPFDWWLARQAATHGPIILAGGLSPENVGEAIAAARPYAVDASSGVEVRPGKKDPARLRAFVSAAKGGG
jgi:phosphoribosylanthranilate isomerase